MSRAFEAIGLEVPHRLAFHHLAERAGNCGEATQLNRGKGIWHGRCWKLGDGLEVWTVLFQSEAGEIFYADCRPAFRSRRVLRVAPWALTEYAEDGAALVHGFIENSNAEVLFELQNLTETNAAAAIKRKNLPVGLCGLAYGAKIETGGKKAVWQPLKNSERENDWTLRGQIADFRPLRNQFSGCDLYWLEIETARSLRLEMLVNQRALRGGHPHIGATVSADIWLQGYILSDKICCEFFEGVDAEANRADFWRKFKRRN